LFCFFIRKSSTTERKVKMQQDFKDKMEKAIADKEMGNALLKAGEFQRACMCYHRVYLHLGPHFTRPPAGGDMAATMAMHAQNQLTPEEKKAALALLVASYNNLALCQLNLGKYQRCVEVATQVLELDSTSSKAHLRRALAHARLGDHEAAEIDMQYLLDHDSSILEGTGLQQEIETARNNVRDRERKMFAGKLFA